MLIKPTKYSRKLPIPDEFYVSPDGTTALFVPDERSYDLRRACGFVEICRRQGLHEGEIQSINEATASKPWLLRYLYRLSDEPPEERLFRARDPNSPAFRHTKGYLLLSNPAAQAMTKITDAMAAFKRGTTVTSSVAAANESISKGRRLTESAVRLWLHDWNERGLEWFQSWLFARDLWEPNWRPPHGVHIATEVEIGRMRTWLSDPFLIKTRNCRYAGKSARTWRAVLYGFMSRIGLYHAADLRQITDLQIELLNWFYGGSQPKNCLIMPLKLRNESSGKAIANKNCSEDTLIGWLAKPQLRKALAAAIARAASPNDPNRPISPEFDRLRPHAQKPMLNVARAAAWPARLNRAGLDDQTWRLIVGHAERLGIADRLWKFVGRDPLGDKENRQQRYVPAGLANDSKSYVPADQELEFREIAERLFSGNRIAELSKLPCFDQWFLHCAIPRMHGKKWKRNRAAVPEQFRRSSGHSNGRSARIRWDVDHGELSVDTVTVKRFVHMHLAKRITPILNAFEEERWPEQIDNPIAGCDRDQLKKVIESLNANLRRMRFFRRGDGNGVRFEIDGKRPG